MTRSHRRVPGHDGRWGVPVVLGVCSVIAFAPLHPEPASAAMSPAATVPAVTVDPGTTPTSTPAAPVSAPVSVPATSSPPPDLGLTSSPAATGVLPDPTTTAPGALTTSPDPSASSAAAGSPGAPSPGGGSGSPTGTTTSIGPSPSPGLSPSAPVPTVAAAQAVSVDDVMLALIPGPGGTPGYLPANTPVDGLDRGATVRVRFRVRNTSPTATAMVIPQLEYRTQPATTTGGAAAPSGPYAVVPVAPDPSVPLYVGREWQQVPGGPGTRLGPIDEVISVAAFRLAPATPVAAGEIAVAGRHSLAENPAPGATLPPGGVTEQEFTLRISEDAPPLTTYQLRLSDAGNSLVGNGIAVVATGPSPGENLSAGQRAGEPVAVARQPVPAVSTAAGTALARSGSPTAVGTEPVHGPYRLDSDQCGSCHRSHQGRSTNLLFTAGSQSTLCFTCHDGTGAPQDVRSGYADPSLPANDPAAGAYYSHDALTASNHSSATVQEFAGVSNRHSECGDCHNAHQAQGSGARASTTQQTAAGWTASGRLKGISGVAVSNGAAGTAPVYTFLDGVSQPITLEYQLCLKCHSGYTVLRPTTGLAPSRYPLDKGVEFNPANGSFHPVEAAGTNQSAAMAASLAGTSPYKLWNFTTGSTVRCTHCHAGSSAAGSGTAADADLSPHVSTNRAILLRPYRDEKLKAAGEGYAAADFALCYTCHAEAPFTGSDPGMTNFGYHRKHVSGISGEGAGGTDINTAGAGQGGALCAECHYRIHGSSSADSAQLLSGSRLVNFAPDVTANNGVISWTRTATGGTCTLTCHGQRHDNFRY